jgi:hypothetical protein
MGSRNIIATVVVLLLFAVIGYVVLSRTNLLGRLRRVAPTPTPAPLDRDIDSGFELSGSSTPFPLILPTPSGSPIGGVRPLGTVTATPTATPVAQCANLTANPASGTAPLSVKFTVVGLPASVAQYEFNFGSTQDNNVVKTSNTTATFSYDNGGTYNASLKAFDKDGNQITSLGNCIRTISVLAKPVATGTPSGSNLPKTGGESFLIVLLAPLAAVGAYLHRKFKLA